MSRGLGFRVLNFSNITKGFFLRVPCWIFDRGAWVLTLRVQGPDPNNRVLGPKYYILNSIGALKPYYLGPWTLRVQTFRHIARKPAKWTLLGKQKVVCLLVSERLVGIQVF